MIIFEFSEYIPWSQRESDARSTGVQLKSAAKPSAVVGLII